MKDFFSFSLLKLIIPVIFLLIFLSLFIAASMENSLYNKFACKYADISLKNQEAVETGNEELFNKAQEERVLIDEELRQEIGERKYIFMYYIAMNRYIAKVNPLYPVDCGLVPENNLCSFYFSEDSYNCAKVLISTNYGLGNLINDKIPSYRGINYSLLLLNLAIFLILGYIISCILSLIYRKIKLKKDNKNKK